MTSQADFRSTSPGRSAGSSFPDRIAMWFRAAAKFIAPELIFPIRCQSCRKWTELLDHEYTDLEEGFLVRYRRCWQCPSCGDRAFETGTFFRHPDHWDVC